MLGKHTVGWYVGHQASNTLSSARRDFFFFFFTADTVVATSSLSMIESMLDESTTSIASGWWWWSSAAMAEEVWHDNNIAIVVNRRSSTAPLRDVLRVIIIFFNRVGVQCLLLDGFFFADLLRHRHSSFFFDWGRFLFVTFMSFSHAAPWELVSFQHPVIEFLLVRRNSVT